MAIDSQGGATDRVRLLTVRHGMVCDRLSRRVWGHREEVIGGSHDVLSDRARCPRTARV